MKRNPNDKSKSLPLSNYSPTPSNDPRPRYASHNTYIGLKRVIHDAQHPGADAPPVPHADTWFAADPTSQSSSAPNASGASGSQPQRKDGGESDSDSSSVEIAYEKTSLRCPITLLPFRDPVTSTKCPHSFERDAIIAMIDGGHAAMRVEGEPLVQCPVCEKMLSRHDLRTDRLLLRKVKRMLERERGGEGGSSGDEEVGEDEDGA